MIDHSASFPRTGLGATLHRISSHRRTVPPCGEGRAPFARLDFAPDPGDLELWLYCPDDLPQRAPLVVLLHGCTQGAAAFASDSGWLTLADRLGFAVLAPQQIARNNANRCFNWFQAEDMRRGSGEPASIAAMVKTVVRSRHLDAQRVFISGLSAGGAMTAVMLAAYPEMFAGGAVIAGVPYGTAQGVGQAFQAMQGRTGLDPAALGNLLRNAGSSGQLPPLTIWHGDADHVVHRGNGVELAHQWAMAQGLGLQPDEVTRATGSARSVWRSADASVVCIELNQVAGLGHGVPLDTRGPEALGRTAPYMLEAGVNSTLGIARFWGLATSDTVALRATEPRQVKASSRTPDAVASSPRGLGEQVMSAVSGVPSDIQAIIAEALAKGGLLRRRG